MRGRPLCDRPQSSLCHRINHPLNDNVECAVFTFSQLFYLLLLLLSQSVKDLNHLLRGVLDNDVSSHIRWLYKFSPNLLQLF